MDSLLLEDQIRNQLAESHFPLGWKQEYMPADRLSKLITRTSIIREFSRDIHSKDQLQGDESLIGFILTSAQKLLAINLITGISSSRLLQTMRILQRTQSTDLDLPVTLEERRSPWASLEWTVTERETFERNQWKFLVHTFREDEDIVEIGNREILPFQLVNEQRRDGTFGDVWEVKIYEAHQEQPMRLLDGSGRLATAAIQAYKILPDQSRPESVSEYLTDRPKKAKSREDEGIIKCICNFAHDDGATVFCEKCNTWQHIDCYYHSPGETEKVKQEDFDHSCADCNPRILDRIQATERQRKRLGLQSDEYSPHDKRPKKAFAARFIEDIKGIRDAHINEVKAMIEWEGKGTFFMSQWADLGNLWDLYQSCPDPVRNAMFVRQIVSQLWGLSSALDHLHDCSYQHGGLRPENILRFENGTSVGILKISGSELASHNMRGPVFCEPTRNRYDNLKYEPPEVERSLVRPRQRDIWSMGCVFFELLVWLLYGYEELEQLGKRMASITDNSSPYWIREEFGMIAQSASVHPIVIGLMEIMVKELARVGPTATGDILELVRRRLLVVPLTSATNSLRQSSTGSSFPAPPKSRAVKFGNDLKRILHRAERDERYAYTRIMPVRLDSVSPVTSIQCPRLAPSRFNKSIPVLKRQEEVSSSFHPSTPTFPAHMSRHDSPESSTKHVDSAEEVDVESLALEEYGQTTASPHDLTRAIESHNHRKTHWLLEKFFEQIAVQEFSWLAELVQLGFSPLEITDELLEKAVQGPWIHQPFEEPHSRPSIPGFHQNCCVHVNNRNENALYVGSAAIFVDPAFKAPRNSGHIVSRPGDDVQSERASRPGSERVLESKESTPTSIPERKREFLTAQQRIEYFCGLGGVRPGADGSTSIQLGSVSFDESNSRASIMLNEPEDNSAVLQVLDGLDQAAGVLQRLGGCCNSFNVLLDAASRDYVELCQIPFETIHSLRELLLDPDLDNSYRRFKSLFSDVFGEAGSMSGSGHPDDAGSLSHWVSLATQFLALGFLSYAQAHCGPIHPFFLDTPLQTISLLGSGRSTPATATTLTCYLVELTCMGEMVGQPVLAFGWLPSADVDRRPVMPLAPPKNMLASPADILDTWGSGYMVAHANDSSVLYSVFVGGGTITSTSTAPDLSTTPQLHWSRHVVTSPTATNTFLKNAKAFIGTTILVNISCQSAAARLKESLPMLEEIGTFPSYWEVIERQVGLGAQAGQAGVAILQFNQTWMKMPGVTKKSAMLSRRVMYTSDLDSMFGVQVSICTGIARRVRLRDLLADLLPAYVSGLVVKPDLWGDLVGRFNAPLALRESDMKQWLEGLDRPYRVEFERLVFEVLHLLRDTGIDHKGDQFVIACVQTDLPFQCFKIPCKNENVWTRMLMDSKDSATFAYVTMQCLETAALKCCRPWCNSAALMGTAVSQDKAAVGKTLTAAHGLGQWTLRENEAYLIGHPDKELYVQVKRPTGLDPHLLVSLSAIPPDFLRRLFRRGKLKRLREKKCFDSCAESVVICTENTSTNMG